MNYSKTAKRNTAIPGLEPEQWRIVNDGVMGGLSVGEMVEFEGGLRFRGDLSLKNSGGFSSVSRPVSADTSNVVGFRLTTKGDGRRYQFRLRHDRNSGDVAWMVEFETTEDWRTVEFYFPEFEPVFRGRSVKTAGNLVPGKIRQLGFLIADRKSGPFRLDIQRIELLKAGN